MMSRVKKSTFDVFVGNLPNYVDKNYVEHMFKYSGEIAGVFVRNSKFDKSKLAYVKFFCKPDALKAVEKYRHLCLDGNALEVRILPSKNEFNSNQGGAQSGNSGCSNSTTSLLSDTVFNQKSGGEEILVVVCHVENPVTFYGQSVSNLLELAGITDKLQKFCSAFSPVEGLPHINQIYATRFSQDKMWYRCRVLHTEKYKSFVSYIDYGNDEHVNNKDIVVLPDDLVKIPPQSRMFVFKDLQSVAAEENKDLHDKAVAYLKKMINEQVKLHTVFSTESFYFINKCIFRNTDVYDELQKKGYAQKVLSSSEKSGSSQKNKMKVPRTNEKNVSFLPDSKGSTQQSFNNKTNAQSSNSFSSTIADRLKAATTSKKQPIKHSGKELCDELQELRLKNDKVTKELILEREKSKALKQELEALKAKVNGNPFEKLDTVILKIQQLFAMRHQHPSEDPSNLEEVYDIVKAKLPCSIPTLHENCDLHEKVEKAISRYQELVEYVGGLEQVDSMSDHIKDRDEACKTACNLMKEYIASWNGDHVEERVVYLKKLLLEMQQKYEKYLKMDVNCNDKSLEDLFGEYRENKVTNKTSLETLAKNTNDALNHFSSIIDNLKKDITVPSDKMEGTSGIFIRFSKAAFIESLKKVCEAVDAEVIAETTQPKSPLSETLIAGLIKSLIREIQIPLEVALQEIEDCKKYNMLYTELCSSLEAKPDTSKISDIRKEIKTLKSKLRHKLADKKDLEESDDVSLPALEGINSAINILLQELHTSFKDEHEEMMKLVNAYKTHFRELNILNPDLNLSSYSKCNGLVKENWEMEHFNFCAILKRPGMCYSSKFCDESVVIKEFHLNCDEFDQFLEKIVLWHSVKDHVVPVHAVFKSKTGFQTYAVFPQFTTLEESEKEFPFSHSDSAQVLRGVLECLVHIHSQNIVHSLLNPSTVLILSDTRAPTPLLDFSFGTSNTVPVWESKGIVFCPPDKELSKSSDMYNFGCLILWMLFPNLQFTSTSNGVVDIAGYKSIVQDLFSNSGYEAVKSLFSVEPSARPAAKAFLEKDIFMQLISSSNGEDPLPASSPEDPLPASSPEDPLRASSPEDPLRASSPEDPLPASSPEDPLPASSPVLQTSEEVSTTMTSELSDTSTSCR